MRGKWTLVLSLALIVVLAAVLAGCDQGGTQDGDNEQGEERPDLRLEVVEQWAQSAHARPIARGAEEEGCKNCHDGLTFTEAGGGFQPRFGEATEPTRPAEGTETTEPARDWVVATDCRACHTGVGVEIAEEGSIDGIPSLDTAEGGRGALCMACHNGWHAAGPGREGNPAAPHYSVQADMLFGVNTLQVGTGTGGGATESDEESASPHLEVEDTCVGCHLGGGDEANHLFVIENYDGCEGEDCHDQDMTDGGDAEEDYDGDGQTEKAAAEVEGLMEKLKAEINRAAGSTDFRSERGDVAFEGGTVTTGDPAYQAAYNYLFVEKDKSRGIHNYQFTVRLLQQSLEGVSQ